MGYLPRRAADSKWTQPKRDKYITVSKDGRVEPSKPLGIRRGATVFEFALLDFGSPLVQYFFSMPLPPTLFWNGNTYSMPLYVGTV